MKITTYLVVATFTAFIHASTKTFNSINSNDDTSSGTAANRITRTKMTAKQQLLHVLAADKQSQKPLPAPPQLPSVASSNVVRQRGESKDSLGQSELFTSSESAAGSKKRQLGHSGSTEWKKKERSRSGSVDSGSHRLSGGRRGSFDSEKEQSLDSSGPMSPPTTPSLDEGSVHSNSDSTSIGTSWKAALPSSSGTRHGWMSVVPSRTTGRRGGQSQFLNKQKMAKEEKIQSPMGAAPSRPLRMPKALVVKGDRTPSIPQNVLLLLHTSRKHLAELKNTEQENKQSVVGKFLTTAGVKKYNLDFCTRRIPSVITESQEHADYLIQICDGYLEYFVANDIASQDYGLIYPQVAWPPAMDYQRKRLASYLKMLTDTTTKSEAWYAMTLLEAMKEDAQIFDVLYVLPAHGTGIKLEFAGDKVHEAHDDILKTRGKSWNETVKKLVLWFKQAQIIG